MRIRPSIERLEEIVTAFTPRNYSSMGLDYPTDPHRDTNEAIADLAAELAALRKEQDSAK